MQRAVLESVSKRSILSQRIVVNAKLTGQKTYSDIMEACFGYKGRAAVAFIQFAMAFGGMCAFAVILGDTIPRESFSFHAGFPFEEAPLTFQPCPDVLTSLLPSFASTGFGGWLFSRQVVTSE